MIRTTCAFFLVFGLFAAVAPLSGCTWVKSKPESTDVRVATAGEVSDCKKVGTTSVSVLSKVAFVGRGEKKMGKELATLARNQAAAKGADTVVASSEIEDGGQDFDLYQCGGD